MRTIKYNEIERPTSPIEFIEVLVHNSNERPIINVSKYRQRFLRFWFFDHDIVPEKTIKLALILDRANIPDELLDIDYIDTIFLDEIGHELHVFYVK